MRVEARRIVWQLGRAPQIPHRDEMPDVLNFICGLPDNRQVRIVRLEPSIAFAWDGTPCFLNEIHQDRPCHSVWLGPASPIKVRLKPGPIVNYVADPDICGAALRSASRVARQLDRPWFNHPDRILATTRDGVSRALQGIAGVLAPKVVRCRPGSVDDIVRAIAENGFDYPVLMRSVGSQRGRSLARIDDADDLQGLAAAMASGPELYISQYHEFADASGLYRKHRLVMIGGQAFLNSLVTGVHWNVHAASRIWNPVTQADEAAALDGFATGLGARLRPRLEEIQRRIGLDFYGIDFAMRPDGTMLIFEANAVMDILSADHLEPDIWADNQQTIKDALLALLDHPERWDASGAAAAKTALPRG